MKIAPADDPSPCRPRFPWAQLAFFIACLGMAVWLWWTYCRCIRVTPAELCAPGACERMAGLYVEVTGQPTYIQRDGKRGIFIGVLDPDVLLDPDLEGADGVGLAAWVRPRRAPGAPAGQTKAGSAPGRADTMELVWPSPSEMTETHRGRVVVMDLSQTYPVVGPRPVVDARMGRFGGEFFAGAAVAAMGALVLVLYLRGWRVAGGPDRAIQSSSWSIRTGFTTETRRH